MDDSLTLLLTAGTILRLSRLIALDTITAPIRDRLFGWWLKLATCGWCLGIWIGFPVAVSWWAWSHCDWWQVTALALTGSWIAGALQFAGMPARHEVEVTPVAPLVVFSPPETPPDGEPRGD